MCKWKSVLAIVLFLAVAAPQVSEAGIGEVIWGLSGPQLVGLGFGCRFSIPDLQRQCLAGSPPTVPLRRRGAPPSGLKPFFSLGGSYFRSTGKDSDTASYKLGEVEMLAFEPGVSVSEAPRGTSDWRFYHGVGISYDFFFGYNFRRFDKFAIKFTPVEATYKRVSVGLTLRLYPHGFSDDEFGKGPRVDYARPSEWAVGYTFAYILK